MGYESVNLLTARRTDNILEWNDADSVKIRERFGDTMTVKMNDGNFYNGVSSEITFSFNKPAGLLGIDASPLSDRAPDMVLSICVPSGENFSIANIN